jgi:hypothetical protein
MRQAPRRHAIARPARTIDARRSTLPPRATGGQRLTRHAPRTPTQINVGRHQRNPGRLELPAPQRLPHIKSNHELRRPEQYRRAPRLPQLHPPEDRLRPIPTPAQTELIEANIETRLRTDQPLERSTMLRYPGYRQLIRQQNDTEERHNTGRD